MANLLCPSACFSSDMLHYTSSIILNFSKCDIIMYTLIFGSFKGQKHKQERERERTKMPWFEGQNRYHTVGAPSQNAYQANTKVSDLLPKAQYCSLDVIPNGLNSYSPCFFHADRVQNFKKVGFMNINLPWLCKSHTGISLSEL